MFMAFLKHVLLKIPYMIRAMKHTIHGDYFSNDDVFCMVIMSQVYNIKHDNVLLELIFITFK